MFDTFKQSYEAFKAAGVGDPAMEALRLLDLLLQGALRQTAVSLPTEPGFHLQELAARRREGVPLEYALGRATFMGLDLICTPATLIPRQETELLAWTALEIVEQMTKASVRPLTIADIGTGCGNLALTLATYTQNTLVLASDISHEAVDVARRNVERLQLQERITLFCGDLLAPIREADYQNLDLIVCNPPYIPTSSLKKLAPEIINHEPVVALDAGAYGLVIFRRLVQEAADLLRPGGKLAFEIGAGQEKLVERLLQRSQQFVNIQYHTDNAGQVRVVSAQKTLEGST